MFSFASLRSSVYVAAVLSHSYFCFSTYCSCTRIIKFIGLIKKKNYYLWWVSLSTPVQTTSATTRHDQLQTRWDISSLEGDVQRYASTRRTYQAGINKFVKFCGLYNISNQCHNHRYAYLANFGQAYGTIKTYLAAIRYLQISRDLPDPRAEPMPKLALVQRGYRVQISVQL